MTTKHPAGPAMTLGNTLGACFVAILFSVAGGAAAFAECETVPKGYRVMAYDGRTHQYTIDHNQIMDGKYLLKKIVLVCDYYQWGGRPPVEGPTACELEVGSFYPVGLAAMTRDQGPATVAESNNKLSIIERWGTKDEVFQNFKVVSIEVLPDTGCR